MMGVADSDVRTKGPDNEKSRKAEKEMKYNSPCFDGGGSDENRRDEMMLVIRISAMCDCSSFDLRLSHEIVFGIESVW